MSERKEKTTSKTEFSNSLELFIKDLLVSKSLSEDQIIQLQKTLNDKSLSTSTTLEAIKDFISKYNEKFDNAVSHVSEIINDTLSRKDELGIFQGQDLFNLIKNYEKDKKELTEFNEELIKYAKAITDRYDDASDSLDHMILTDKKDIRPREKNLSVGYAMLNIQCDIIGSYLNDNYTVLECKEEGTLDTEKKMSDVKNNTTLVCKYL